MFALLALAASGAYLASGAVTDAWESWRDDAVVYAVSAVVLLVGLFLVLTAGAAFLVQSGWIKATLGSVPAAFKPRPTFGTAYSRALATWLGR